MDNAYAASGYIARYTNQQQSDIADLEPLLSVMRKTNT